MDYEDKDEEGNLKLVDWDGSRKRKYNEDDFMLIVERIAGGELLPHICKAEDMPSTSWFLNQVSSDERLAREYIKARKYRAVVMSEQSLDIAADSDPDGYVDENGKPVWNYEHIQRSKLRIDTMFRIIKADLPELFGDRIEMKEVKGNTKHMVDAPPQESRKEFEARQRERLASLSAPDASHTLSTEGEE